jgi:hypothetical protein
MKFFTKEWLRGELSDDAFEAVPADYLRHLTELKLPPNIAVLANINLHDARVLHTRFDPAATLLSLRVRRGDLQRGYLESGFDYSGALVDDEGIVNLHRAVTEPYDEVLYDEIGRIGDRFEHRLIFASHREVYVSFSSVKVVSA